MAPETDHSVVANGEGETSQNTDWINSILPSETVQSDPAYPTSSQPPIIENAPEVVGSELSSPVNEELPDWFKTTTLPTDDSLFASQSNEPLPDWLTEISETPDSTSVIENAPDVQSTVVLPVEPEDEQHASTESSTIVEPNPSSPALPEIQSAVLPPTDASESGPDFANFDDAMAWLENLAAKNGAEEETLLTRPEDRSTVPPEWITLAAQEQAVKANAQEDQEPPVTTPPEIDRSEEAVTSPVEPSEPDTETILIPAETTDSTPISQPQESPEPNLMDRSVDMETNAADLINLDDQILSIESTLPAEDEKPSGEENGADETTTPVSSFNPENSEKDNVDSAFAWLESLAARQGAEADSLLVSPEDRQETPPDWVTTQSADAEIQNDISISPEISPSSEQIPAWMKTTEDTPSPEKEIIADAGEQALPDWLKGLESSSDIPYTPSDEAQLPASAQSNVEPEWIQEQELSSSQNNSAQEVLPASSASSMSETTEEIEPPASLGKTRPLPSWMVKDSDSSQPVVPIESQSEEAQEPSLPDWLKDEKQPETQQAAPQIQNEGESPALPDWLKNLESEQDDIALPVASIPTLTSDSTAGSVVISSIPSEMLGQAQEALSKGQIDLSMTIYNQLIQQDQHIDDTIHDLRDALYRFPVESEIWQTLGDAYFRGNHVQDALDAYTKAEELLK
jgi:hypothetical protein